MDDQNKVDVAIESLLEDFSQYPNKYLSEEDVRLHLCLKLMPDYGTIKKTKDNSYSISLHTEVRWWGPDSSKKRSDIVLFDTRYLEVTKEVLKKQEKRDLIPKKGYAFDKPLAIIELKLRRSTEKTSDKQYCVNIRKDIKKLKDIEKMFKNYYKCIPVIRMVALDKKEDISNILFSSPRDELLSYRFSE